MKNLYLLDLYTNTYVYKSANLEEMIDFLSMKTNRWFNGTYHCVYLDEINLNYNDKVYLFDKDYNGDFFTRRYMFIDDGGKIYDMRKYFSEIKSKIRDFEKQNKKSDNDLKYGDKLSIHSWYLGCNCCFRYRIDPVPFTAHPKHGHFFRYPRTFQEIRNQHSEEGAKYGRARRKYIPTVYDDVPRHIDKSWKNKKIKKQWQKNL